MSRDTLHGSAAWASAAEIAEAGLCRRPGLPFGHGPDGAALLLDGDAPAFTAAGSGSGKGTTIIIPANLDYPGPLFVFDPKGENAAVTLHHQHKLGKDAYCINPFGLHCGPPWFLPTHKVNPLDVLARDGDSLSLFADCKLVAEMLIPKHLNGGDDYWTLKPREIVFAVLFWHTVTTGWVDATRFYALLSSIYAEPALWRRIVRELMAFPNVEVRRVIGEIEAKSEKAQGEFSGITGKLFEALSFIADPALSRCLRGGDFSLSVLTGERPATVYLIMPGEYLKNYASFVRLMVGVAMLYKGWRRASPRVVFLLDEASQLGHFEMLETAFSFKRGGGVRAWAFFQSVGQVEEHYGYAGAKTLIESAQLRQFFGVGHPDTARVVSAMLGMQTVLFDDPLYQTAHRQQAMGLLLSGNGSPQSVLAAAAQLELSRMQSAAQRPLMLPDEVLRLTSRQQICFVSAKDACLHPILGWRWPYYLRPDLAGTYLPNPDRPPYDRVEVAERFGKQRQWKVWTHEVLPPLAGLPQFQQGMMSYAAKAPLMASRNTRTGAKGSFFARAVRLCLPAPKTSP